MMELICLLLPVAFGMGWYKGRRSQNEDLSFKKAELSSDYYAGLNFLLNEQTDKAVDAFIRMLEVSPDTIETTLALGVFFRRRGEVDRAIRIHQNLIANPNLTNKQRSQALLELAQDYLRAGVYDRAEQLLIEITDKMGDELDASLRHLKDIYEREKDWEKAIKVAVRLQAVGKQSMSKEIAHYYCELAETAWSKGKIRVASNELKKALRVDPLCARASLLQGTYEKKLGKFTEAISAYQRILDQDISFLPEALPMLIECYERLGQNAALEELLHYLLHHCPSVSIVLANVEKVKERDGKENAASFLVNHMYQQPSVRGLKHLIELHLGKVVGEVRNELLMLKSLVEQLIDNKPVYRCGHCGFSSRLLHWQCPSCRQWAVVKPIQGIEGV